MNFANYQQPDNLQNFIQVFGNKYKRLHYLAIRFKRAIIIYKPNTLDTIAINPPEDSIIFIRGKCPPFVTQQKSFLLFTDDLNMQGITVPNSSTNALLRALFPTDKILLSYFKLDVLYLIATANPFSSFMQKCRKDQSFQALYNIVEARLGRRAFTLPEVAQLRFFKSNQNNLKQFNRWSAFAFYLCNESCYQVTYAHPSAYLGKAVYWILNRSNLPPGPLPPPDFYQCEILYTDTEPVGVAFATSIHNEQDLEYVSPMVVTKPQVSFRDTCSVMCNSWMPLYKNKETWEKYSLGYYLYGFFYKKNRLKQILSWLQIQTSEKYRLLYLDLKQVAKILFGEESKTFI